MQLQVELKVEKVTQVIRQKVVARAVQAVRAFCR